jgi:GT2 family glycosyltransferase
MKTSFLICNYNSDELLLKCIKSIYNLNNKNVEIYIYDNLSSDNSLNFISQSNFENLHIIHGNSNLGYGRAINHIAKISLCENLFILNPDAELLFTNIEFEELSNSLMENEIIGFQIFNNEGKLQNFDSQPPGLFWLNSSLFRVIYPHVAKYFYDFYFFLRSSKKTSSNKQKSFLIPGCALLLKRKLFYDLGMFNEKYFLYFEDTELLHKAYDLGCSIYLSNLKINHNASYSVNKSDNSIKIERYKSFFIYIKNFHNKIYYNISIINFFLLCLISFTNPKIIFNTNRRNYFFRLYKMIFFN